ncbi:wall-associated receptor kinase-like 14 isoform X2 [Ziziphus jujuba]|nr:wall-associated receptor kinase-like 14 isoform X2 [Ziziphus jujuba]
MILQQTALALIILVFMASSTSTATTEAKYSNNCTQFCGKSAKRVLYPFGFGGGCEIPLNCSKNGDVRIGEFQVQNITSRSIFINLPADCNRPSHSIFKLFNQKNYGISVQNGLLLQKCGSNSSLGGCVVTSFVEQRFGLKGCGNSSQNDTRCFTPNEPNGDDKFEILSDKDSKVLHNSNCSVLFSSVNFNSTTSSVSLQFEKLELRWWLSYHDCDPNASTENVSLHGGQSGFRCLCNDGFQGDGYRAGSGCHRVSECTPPKFLSGRCGRKKEIGIIVAVVIAGASLAVVLFLCCYFVRRRFTCLKNRMSAKRLLCDAAGSSSVPLYPYKEIEKATNSFCEKQRLGTGAFGTVYAGKLHNDNLVAIKKIKYRDNNSIDQVMNEIKLLSSVSHPNLVRLLGCCIEEGEQILVYEYMPNGTLSQHLQRKRSKGLPWTIRLNIAAETANAIAYLHSAVHPPIYHRDIKSSNILLDFSFRSKVADFGLSRIGMTESSHISTAPQGTPGYVDPQYHQNFHLSDKSDVYSFGVVLVEIITALKVVDFNRPPSEVNLAALAIDRIGKGCVDEIIDPFLDPHRDAWTLYSVNKVAELAFRCLAFHSDTRPTMMEVADELQHIRQSGWATMEENICFASSVVSSCSLASNGSDRSLGDGTATKNDVVGKSQKLVVPQRLGNLESMDDNDSSPVSVHDPWLSEQSSPSANSLLGNIVR